LINFGKTDQVRRFSPKLINAETVSPKLINAEKILGQ
jgi:hypothetical protein